MSRNIRVAGDLYHKEPKIKKSVHIFNNLAAFSFEIERNRYAYNKI